jgi:hypothetical protein
MAEVIGRPATIALIAAARGAGSRRWRVCLYVPKKVRRAHWIARLIGQELADELVSAFGGEILQPSNLSYIERRWRAWAAHKLHRDGYKRADIAANLELSRAHVCEILRMPVPPASGPEPASCGTRQRIAAPRGAMLHGKNDRSSHVPDPAEPPSRPERQADA